MPWGPEDFAKHLFPRSTRKMPVYATLLKHPNYGITAEEINKELGLETDDATIDETQRVLREIEDSIEKNTRKNPRGGRPQNVYKPGSLKEMYQGQIYFHVLGKERLGYADSRADIILTPSKEDTRVDDLLESLKIDSEQFRRMFDDIDEPFLSQSNGGGAPRCKQAGHARRRRMKLILNRSDQFLSRTRMPFIPDASIGVLR